MDGFPCHQDLQVSDGEALLLQYVTKYCAIFSDSNYDEWFSDEASPDSVARRVCCEYHPYEPEMLLQLAGQLFRQWHISTVSRGKTDVRAPWPGMTQVPEFVNTYMQSTWHNGELPLLDFLRRTNNKGESSGWLQKLWKKSAVKSAHDLYVSAGGQENYQTFAQGCTQKGFREFARAGGNSDFRAYLVQYANKKLEQEGV